ncbi:MAG: sulfur oxidation c-type cytochrome SoxX [Gammaproteobacteria bacterium]|nr:sulfur oxidation c-type cytochrome SoxX [Gammaproteobacteria bacterium]MCF6230484.1 sulfur oxidation c-type cytochrome SoxX [Gammaproteobacteria bacterium]
MINHKQVLLGLWLSLCGGAVYAESSVGQQLALDSNKGHCHACHVLPGAQNSGTIGPSIQAIAQKFPDIKQLQAFIRDPALSNPNTIMPPYGRHRILTESEIIEISEFIYQL